MESFGVSYGVSCENSMIDVVTGGTRARHGTVG
jgi:hypothetical protein